jgi:hypothetical protein
MSHWTEKLIDFCKFDTVMDQNETNLINLSGSYGVTQICPLSEKNITGTQF